VTGCSFGSPRGWCLAFAVSLTTALVSCGGQAQETRTVTVERQVATKPVERPRPVKQQSSQKRPPTRPAPLWVPCDPNVEALAETTTCPFAQNTFWSYWTAKRADSFDVWSPASQSSFTMSCSSDGMQVVCAAADGGKVRFPDSAVAAYSQDQADAYAADHDLGPDPYEGLPHSEPPPSAPEPVPVPEEDDHEYYEPPPVPEEDPPAYEYHEPAPERGENIPNYENGRGYRVQCEDGTYSRSGGIQGACSWHGGVAD
jgi:hypothetical protein